jgi:hypothetical protein
VGTGRPLIADEILRMDGDALALWLLRELNEAPPIRKGENFISESLAEWFPDSRRIGSMTQLDQYGIPKASSTEPNRVERRLRDAYPPADEQQLDSRRFGIGRQLLRDH